MESSVVVELSTKGCVYASFLVEWIFQTGNQTMDKTQAEALGAMLRQRRKTLGLTVRQMKSATGIDNATISRIETGSFRAPRPDKLARIAQVLRLSVGELFSRAGYLVAADLPEFPTYLRTSYPTLPESAIERLHEQFTEMLDLHGISPSVLPDLTDREEQIEESPGVTQ